MKDNIFSSYLQLPKNQKVLINTVIIVLGIFILYIIGFFICKGIAIDKAKDFLVGKGIGSNKNAIKLKVSVDPFTCYSGRVHKVDLYVDTVKIENITYIHNVEIHTTGLNFKKIKDIENGLDVGASVYFSLQENDLLSIINEKFTNNYVNVTASEGNISFNTSFGKTITAKPYLLNNCIFLDFNAEIFNYPIKVIDFGVITKNKLNIYECEYSDGAYNFKGTLI